MQGVDPMVYAVSMSQPEHPTSPSDRHLWSVWFQGNPRVVKIVDSAQDDPDPDEGLQFLVEFVIPVRDEHSFSLNAHHVYYDLVPAISLSVPTWDDLDDLEQELVRRVRLAEDAARKAADELATVQTKLDDVQTVLWGPAEEAKV